MFPAQIPPPDPDELLRPEDSSQLLAEQQKSHDENSIADSALTREVDHALWKNIAFKAKNYQNIDVQVSGGIVSLYGHVSSLKNQCKAEKAIQGVDGVLGIKNHLISDDRLATEVATALGQLESTYNCKFFAEVSHGVVLLNTDINHTNIKLLAEEIISSNKNAHGANNSLRVRESGLDSEGQPFLQPSFGVEIFFLDGNSGRVRQVIINRRIVAMTIQERFANQQQEFESMNNDEARSPERLIALSLNLVRYLTKVSGFLYINSSKRKWYTDFEPAHFFSPKKDWKALYPNRPNGALFPIEQPDVQDQILQELPQSLFAVALEEQSVRERLISANDSLMLPVPK